MSEIKSLYDVKSDCCGCTCCANICPQKAIYIQEDENGYKYPFIDKDKCINCGLCKRSCRYQSMKKELHETQRVYAAVTKNEDLIKKSASGGIFADIARNFLKENGIVYGSAMNYKDGKLIVEHIRIDSISELIQLQGSKYVQSNIEKCYSLIKEDLKNGKKVLFSGTPCQVDAIKEYTKYIKSDNLYLIDIICHGVPNNRMFNEYIQLLEKKYKGKIIDFKFREKSRKWGLNALAVIKKRKKIIKRFIPAYNSSYYQLFLDSEIYRENCYQCPYASSKRTGDITIGDFWKVEKEHRKEILAEEYNIENGVSCLLCNTKKGNFLIAKYGKNLKLLESEFEKVAKHNAQLVKPSQITQNRDFLLNYYEIEGYKAIDKYYWRKNLKKIIAKKFWYRLPLKFRTKIR